MTLREKLRIKNGDVIITPQMVQELFIDHVWDYISKMFFDWRVDFRHNISVHLIQNEGFFCIELKDGDNSLTLINVIHEFSNEEASEIKLKIMLKGIREEMMVKPEGDTEIVIWY